jgi:hypothetical protein
MKVDNKTFVPDFAGEVSGTPGKGVVRLEVSTTLGNTYEITAPEVLVDVRFNQFQSRLGATHFIDRTNSSTNISFQRGVPDEAHRSVDIGGALTGRNIYETPAITHVNYAGSNTKMKVEYVQRALSLGSKFLPLRTFVKMADATSLALQTNSELTFMLRIMIDDSRVGDASATPEDKAILSIGAGALTSYQINVEGRQDVGSGIRLTGKVINSDGADHDISTVANALQANRWYTVFFNVKKESTTSSRQQVRVYEIQKVATLASTKDAGSLVTKTGPTTAAGITFVGHPTTPSLVIGYGEDSGGRNADFTTEDFVQGVHIAELAVWKGVLNDTTMNQLAASHIKRNNYESGIDSRPVKRTQQIFDSMDSYPSQRKMTGKKLSTSIKDNLFDTTIEHTFGSQRNTRADGKDDRHHEMMVYPEMIPARLYSGSGGSWYNGSYFPYEKTRHGHPATEHQPGAPLVRIPLKDGQYRDVRGTPFEDRLVTTGAYRPGVAHKETELLNKVFEQDVTDALGGLISPFNDNQAGGASVINEIAVPENVFPGLNQRVGDLITIEIPIPTIDNTIMGADPDQGRIASMAYYNFNSQAWDRKFMPGISGSNIRSAADLGGSNGTSADLSTSFWQDARGFLVNSCSIGFGGTSGFTIFSDEADRALMDLSSRGRPTSMYGFPHTDQYVALPSQALKISDYIDGPFLLEKIAIEFDGEVEESGPNSIATIIRTPARWKSAIQGYVTEAGSPGSARSTTKLGGNPGAPMFYRSIEVPDEPTGVVDVATGLAVPGRMAIQMPRDAKKWGCSKYQAGIADSNFYGDPAWAQLTAQAHMNPFPIFVGGSTAPAYAEFFDAWSDISETHWDDTTWSEQALPMGFQNSYDRLLAIQDTTNAPSSFSGAGRIRWRGWKNQEEPVGSRSGFPDLLPTVTGYYSSVPSNTQYYNIPAGIFLPQIERAPSLVLTSSTNHGRRDGQGYGGGIKLLFGGLSGLVTGSYLANDPWWDANAEELKYTQYYSSGSSPIIGQTPGRTGGRLAADRYGRWYKPHWMSRNYISFIDSFSIDDTGNMTSTAGIQNGVARNKGGSGETGLFIGTPDESPYPSYAIPKSTGGAPFWRCDTFFLLHQKKGKARFTSGEADIITAPEKQSFEKLQGITSPIIDGTYQYQTERTGVTPPSTWGYLRDNTHQSAVLASAYSDGLGSWTTANKYHFHTIANRRKRIKIEETMDEFIASTRTTHRELITYAQITHYGFAASKAVIPGAIIPPENYYASSSAVGGTHDGDGNWTTDMMKGTGPANTLLPVTRSFYSQAIKLGATNESWAPINEADPSAKKYWGILGAGVRTAYSTRHRLYNSTIATTPEYYATASDQVATYYGVSPINRDAFERDIALRRRGIMGHLTRTGSAPTYSAATPATWGPNAMFVDPGAGSGNGLFWRFSEYDAVPENGYSGGPHYGTSYTSGKQFMRVFRWDQWFENPVCGGQRETWINTTTSPGSIFPPGDHSAGADYSGGVSRNFGVAPGAVPIAVPNVAHGVDAMATGSHCGTKLNYMQIDWRYQCGVHYNSAVDVAPIGTTPGGRFRTGEASMALDGSNKNKMVWHTVGGRAFTDRAGHVTHELTGSDFIGSLVSSASQPWHGTAITRTGFSIITSPTTPVPSGTHPDYTSYGSFNSPGLLKHQGGVGGYCSIGRPLYLKPAGLMSGNVEHILPSWLDAGLSRDLNIEVGHKFIHARKDLNAGIAGFTILTASTVFPPGDFAGRFNGDHKLRATFKEKRLLNAGAFRVVSDVKAQPATNTDTAALFCFTVPAKRQFLVGTASLELGPLSESYDSANENLEFGDNSRFSNDRIWWRAYGIDSGYIGDTTSKNWEALTGIPPTLASGRRYTAAVPGNIPVTPSQNLLSSASILRRADVNIPQTAPGPGLFRQSSSANVNWGNPYVQPVYGGAYAGRQQTAQQSGINSGLTSQPLGLIPSEWSKASVPYTSSSLAADKPQTSLYLLMPGDEIVLGFQPSLHGSNRGINSIPTNVNVNPYGPWRDGIVDRQGIPTGSAYNPEWDYSVGATGAARTELLDSRGQGGYHLRRGPNKIITDENGIHKSVNNANMESLYEPRSSFTIKKSRTAKLVLYGTLLRNTKHAPPHSTTPSQRTSTIHEAIMGAPVVDQYQIEPTHAYTGSYIAHHITGSILEYQKNSAAMGLSRVGPGTGLPLAGSVFDPQSPSFITLGAPQAYLQQYERRVWRPNIAYNKKFWKGLGGPNYAKPAAANPNAPTGAELLTWSHNYWPKALSTSLSMGISGSVQRFVRLADDSEFYYDSFVPNPAAMNALDLATSGSMAAKGAYAIDKTQVRNNTQIIWNLGDTSSVANFSNIHSSAPDGTNAPYKPYFPNQYWKSSFPFENRYNSVKRMINPSIVGFGTTGSQSLVAIMNTLDTKTRTSNLHHPSGTMALCSTIRVAQPQNYLPGLASAGPEGDRPPTNLDYSKAPHDTNIMTRALLFGFWKTEYRTSGPQPTLCAGLLPIALPTDQQWIPADHGGEAQPAEWAPERTYWQIDHPSGWKYGLMNYQKTKSTAVFRHDTYGQFRDMLEQRQYTRFYDAGDESTPPGLQESAVTCIFVDGDGVPTSDPRLTSCLNVSKAMTSSIPYKEGETTRTFLFSGELITINPLVQSFTDSPFLKQRG